MSHSLAGAAPAASLSFQAGGQCPPAFRLRGLAAVSLAVLLGVGATGPAAAVIAPMAIPAATAEAQDTIGELGARPGATRLPISISDSVNASVDVGTGNVMFNIAGLAASGAGMVGLVNNSQSTERSETSALPQRFELTAGSAGSLTSVSGGVLYEGGDGYSAKFTAVAGSTTAFTPAKGVKADLVKTSTGYTLTSRTTAEVTTFNADGQVLSVADRNGNKTTYTYTDGLISKITGFSGPTGARTATITTESPQV